MKTSKILFFALFCGIGLTAFADSFLTAQSFPEPFKDISFSDKMDFETKDYAQYAPEYDDKGVCIKNCAFPTLNMKDRTESIEAGLLIDPEESEGYDDGEDVTLDMEFDENGNCISGCDGENISYDKFNEEMNKRSEQAYKESLEYQERQKTNPDQTGYDYNCAGRNTEIPVGQKIPYSEPLKGKPRITDWFGSLRSFRRNKTTGKIRPHGGIDYSTNHKIGMTVYAPADGIVTAVTNGGGCGKGLYISHGDGLVTQYCHLSEQIANRKDLKVAAGCPIAKTGNTGHSTGPHLHYGIKKNGRWINPGIYTGRSR